MIFFLSFAVHLPRQRSPRPPTTLNPLTTHLLARKRKKYQPAMENKRKKPRSKKNLSTGQMAARSLKKVQDSRVESLLAPGFPTAAEESYTQCHGHADEAPDNDDDDDEDEKVGTICRTG